MARKTPPPPPPTGFRASAGDVRRLPHEPPMSDETWQVMGFVPTIYVSVVQKKMSQNTLCRQRKTEQDHKINQCHG